MKINSIISSLKKHRSFWASFILLIIFLNYYEYFHKEPESSKEIHEAVKLAEKCDVMAEVNALDISCNDQISCSNKIANLESYYQDCAKDNVQTKPIKEALSTIKSYPNGVPISVSNRFSDSHRVAAAIGDTADFVLKHTYWGKPERVNTTTTKNGEEEQWVYYSGYLYFYNGKLTAIQKTK
jgi:hypothetical protein